MAEQTPRAVVADASGQIIDHPELEMVVWDGDLLRPPRREELIQLPKGSDLFALPGRIPLAGDPDIGQAAVGQGSTLDEQIEHQRSPLL